MDQIRFRFDPEKLVQAIAYLSAHGVRQLSKLKLTKLLYFADKYHLLRFGRPILGDRYYCLDFGPVPSVALNLLNEQISPSEEPGPHSELFRQYLTVDTRVRYPEFNAAREPDTSALTGSDREALDHTIQQYGTLSALQLRDLSHRDPTWLIPDCDRPQGSSVEIPYELFFEGADEATRQMLAFIQEQQEQDRLAEALAN